MVQILYEHSIEWPADGPLRVDAQVHLQGEIPVSPESARRCANGYLGMYVGMAFRAGNPVLVWGRHPAWRAQVSLHLRGLGEVATFGTLDVDAVTREVKPLSEAEIAEWQGRADDIALRLTPATDSRS